MNQQQIGITAKKIVMMKCINDSIRFTNLAAVRWKLAATLSVGRFCFKSDDDIIKEKQASGGMCPLFADFCP